MRRKILKKITVEDCIKLAKEKDGYCLSKEYINNHTKMEWQCEFGHSFSMRMADVKKGRWCPKCGGNARLTIEECNKFAESKNGKCLSSEYINARTKMLWECEFGHQWNSVFYSLKNEGTWCPECSKNFKLTINDCHEFAKSKNGYCLSAEYINAQSKLKWQCEFGHTWSVSFNCIKSHKSWCPKCNYSGKVVRDKLLNILSKLYSDYTIQINKRDIPWLKGPYGGQMEIDYFITNGTKTIAIEYDGRQHFMPVEFGGISKEAAEKEFQIIQQRDSLKNLLISQHPNEISHFIRIPYTIPLTKIAINNFLQENLYKVV